MKYFHKIGMDGTDFMTLLPIEVIEEILLYLTGDEIIKCSKVCKSWERIINEESLWRHLCVRKGLNSRSKQNFTNETTIQSWREYYWSIHNWQNMQFVCHTVEDDGAIEQVQLIGTTMLIPGKCRIRVWNIENVPKMEQELETITCKGDGFFLRVNGNFLIYESGSIVQIYHKNVHKFSLSKIFFFNNKKLCNCDSVDDLIEEYSNVIKAFHLREREMSSYVLVELNDTTLAVFQGDVLFVWFLDIWHRHTVVIPNYFSCVYAIRIQLPRIYLVTLIDTQYVIKVYDLIKKDWIMDLLHITNEDQKLMLQPRLILGSQYIVTAGVCVRDPMANSVIYLKVWRTEDGDLVSTLNLPYCYFNCFLVNDIIILTISSNAITVWDPLKNLKIRKLTLHDNKFSLIKPVSENLLVVSYSNFFEVWNWKTGLRLYETPPNYVCSYNQKMNSLFYIQPDAECNLLPHEINTPKKVIIFNFREHSSVVRKVFR